MAVIYITEADNTQHKFRLPADEGAVVTIGRNEDCLISLPGVLGISGVHCSISLVGGEYVITDEGSSNGTMDGERAVSSEALREGVAYGIGNALLYFDAEAAPAAPVEEPLAEPIPVSEYAQPVEAAVPVEEAAPVAPVRKRKAAPSPLKVPKLKKKSEAMGFAQLLYVVVVLALAFYAGLTLRHWMATGEFLPQADSAPAKAAKK